MQLFNVSFDQAPYTYTEEHLREIAFPLGGLGAGCVSLDGRGGLRDWEIFNRPNKGSILETTFPAIWIQEEGKSPLARRLLGPRVKDWMGENRSFWSYGHGRFFEQMDGLPGCESVEFKGTFPVARISFELSESPLEIELAAFSPFIPLDTRSSSFPVACLVYRIRNRSCNPVNATLSWSMMNPIGATDSEPGSVEHRALNEFFESESCQGILFTNARYGREHHLHGTAALSTSWENVAVLPQWIRSEWFDAVQSFWNEFRETGQFGEVKAATQGTRCSGSLGAMVSLAPGEEAEIPFLFSWVLPVAHKYWGGNNETQSPPWKPWYATQWQSAQDVASEFFDRFDELCSRTLAFEDALFNSTLPSEVIESVSATASILHSPTVTRLEDGTFWAWEGCSAQEGCCPGSCTHVWNYALTQAYLFPEMQWSLRRTDFQNSFNCGPEGKRGAMNFRVMLPIGQEAPLWHAASDGQLGGVIQLYRDWRLSGDDESLKELWPKAKLALEYAWVLWDRDRDGLVDGDMHNTYDINFQGPNPLTQFFYMGALRAGEEMAAYLGDEHSSRVYHNLLEMAKEKVTSHLWNGEFFEQLEEFLGRDAPKYQHGKGCLTDQLFGQLATSIAGLGRLVDSELIGKALKSIFQYNFRSPLRGHENLQRVYAVEDESGLLLCSWPNGGRPFYPFVYSDEVWTGIEYQVATHLILEGFVDEALQIVRAVRARYNGIRRNPYNEVECGSHYARALASYGLLIAMSGFNYDALDRRAEVGSPAAQSDGLQSFFCVPSGWGVFRTQDGRTTFDLVEGTLFPRGH